MVLLGITSCASYKKGIKFRKMEDGVYANIKTSYGDVLVRLYHERAPMTVANFVGLAEGTIENAAVEPGEPYFDSTRIHRVVKGFVIQGGDPEGTGRGGPGYSFPNEIHPELKHDKAGILSMANAGPHTNGSQFFITLNKTPHLDGGYSVFGEVVNGMDVVDSLGKVKTGGNQRDTPLEDIYITKVKIIRKGKAAKKFDAPATFWEKRDALSKELGMRMYQSPAQQNFLEYVEENYPEYKMTASGLMYVIDEKGEGKRPRAGNVLSVHYKGSFTDGKVFDSSYKRGAPIKFPVGRGKVIRGWDEGLLLFNEGGKGKLLIPYPLAYGEKGSQGNIPPKANLVFEVELVEVQ